MKKALSAIAFSCIAALSMTSLAACGSSHTHTYGDWVLTTAPSTTEHGVLTRTCSGDSSHTETKFMPYLNSTDYTVELVNATCTTAGHCTYTWKNTNYTINGAQIAITVYTGYEATGHSYTSEVTTAATCDEDGVMTYTCSSCGDTYTDAIPATGHSYTYATMNWSADYSATATFICANGHTTDVAATVSSSTTPATCTTDGKTVYTATVSADKSLTGVAITETKEVTIPATNHSYTYTGITWTETSDGYTAVANYVCANDGTHTATVTANVSSEKTESTCSTAGNITYTATVSASESLTGTAVSDTKVVALNNADHTAGTAVKEYEVAATCTTDASYDLVVYCTECGAEISRDHVVETGTATGHSYALDENGWTWTEDAQNGGYTASASFTCSACGDTKTVSATVTSETTEATCTEDGKIVYTATISAENSPTGEAISDTKEVTIEATGHDYTSEVTKEATCTEDGVKTYTCSACGDTYTETIKATGHDYEAVVTAPTCTEKGYTTYTCSVCGDTYTADETEATGHKYEATVTAPTCTEKGYTTYTCSACGDTYTADETEATGHSWGEGVVTTAATCTQDGVMTYTCSSCGETKTEAISATGHTAAEAVIENEKAATCTEDGSYDSVVYCSICHTEISRETITVPATGHTYGTEYLVYSEGSWWATCTNCHGTLTGGTKEITENYSGYTFLADSSAALASAIKLNATNIQLTANISIHIDDFNGTTFASDSTVKTNMTIDVAGYVLTISTDTASSTDGVGIYVQSESSLTFTDSENESGSSSTTTKLYLKNRTITDPEKTCVYIKANSSFTLNDIVVESVGCTMWPAGSGATVNIKNSRVTSSGSSVVATNAGNDSNYGVDINIDGSYLECTAAWSYVVCINVTGTLDINNSTIVGKMQGVIVRAGTATITNTTINCTMAETEITETMIGYTTTPSTWDNNPNIALGAVVVGNVTTGTYHDNAKLTITDCNISYKVTDDKTDVDYSAYAIALYLVRLGSTSYTTTVELSGTNSITGYVINIVGDTYSTSNLSGYSGTVYTYAYDADSLTAALNANATNVILTKNITCDVTISSGTVTIDLNGYTLTNSSSDTITVNSGATLTIADTSTIGTGTIDNVTHRKAAIKNYGTVYILGGTYSRSAEASTSSSVSGNNSYYTIENQGTMVIGSDEESATNNIVVTTRTSGNENNTYGRYSSLIRNGGIYTSSLTIYGGTFNGGLNTVKNDQYGTLVIEGGTFSNTAQHVIMNWNIATINGGTFTVSSSGYSVIWVGNYNSVVTSGTDGNLTINGGTFNAEVGYSVNISSTYASGVTVTITGGTFSGGINYASNATLSITGGTYTTDVSTYVASGYTCSGSESSYTVTATNTEGE